MKIRHVTFLSFFFYLTSLNYCQEFGTHFILNTEITGTKNYVASEYIKLQPGFHYIAQGQDYFKSVISNSFLTELSFQDARPNQNRILNTNLPVGTTEGRISVSPTGAAVCEIPIIIPPGTNGMQPNISIVYNSQAGDEILGIGWGLAGISAITRVPATKYHDDIQGDAVDYDGNDRFILDGTRLILENETQTYGAHHTTYLSETNSFSKITSYGSQGGGPEYFIVETKDGTSYYYGTTGDSRIEKQGNPNGPVLIWYLSKVTDIHQNTIEYYYHENNSSGESWISKILYTKNNSHDHFNVILFIYGKSDILLDCKFVGGSKTLNRTKLVGINVTVEGQVARKYSFKYYNEKSVLDPYYHLYEINETDHNGIALNSTVINWGNPTSRYEVINSFDNGKANKFCFNDFNGDGITDFARYPNKDVFDAQDKFQFYFGDGVGNFLFVDEQLMFENSYGETFDDDFHSFMNVQNQRFDFDGDGKEDFLKTWGPYIEGQDTFNTHVIYKFNNSNTLELLLGPVFTDIGEVVVGNFFGDNKSRIMVIAKDKNLLQVLGYGDPSIRNYNCSLSGSTSKSFVTDINGNGRDEIMIVYLNQTHVYEIFPDGSIVRILLDNFTHYQGIFPGDFNGDGKTDFLTWQDTAYWRIHQDSVYWRIHVSTGTNIEKLDCYIGLNIVDPDISVYNNNVYISDFNGDGRMDIAEIYDSSDVKILRKFYCIGYPNPELLPYKMFYIEREILNPNLFPSIKSNYFHIGSFFGDGKQNLFYHRTHDASAARIISFHKWEESFLVKSILDGFNNKTEFSYSTLSSGSGIIYNKSAPSQFPMICFNGPLYVVYKTTRPGCDPNPFRIEETYKYSDAMLHLEGKGFLGFKTVTSQNTATNIKQRSEYEVKRSIMGKDHYFPLPVKINVESIPGAFISETNYTYGYQSYGKLQRSVFPYVSESSSYDQLRQTVFQTNITYDPIHGTLLNSHSQSFDKNGQNLELISTESIVYDNWIDAIPSDGNMYLNRPGTIATTKTHSDDPGIQYIRTSSLTYNSKGQVLSQVSDPGKPKAVISETVYAPDGNFIARKHRADGYDERCTSYEFEQYGRFIIKETNALGHEINRTYDPVTSNVLTMTDINGKVTGYTYDGFGRLNRTSLPTGEIITNSTGYYSGSDPVLAKCLYFTLTGSQIHAPVKTYFDPLGNIIREERIGFDGRVVYQDYIYYRDGKIKEKTNPYYQSPQVIQYQYDTSNRLIKETSPQNWVIQYDYSQPRTVKTLNTTTYPVQWSSKTYNADGSIVSAEDLGGIINYKYDASGQVKKITSSENIILFTYDEYGMQTSLADPDAGLIEYDYNPFGELIFQKDQRGNETQMSYDVLGRIDNQTTAEGVTDYQYISSGHGIGQIGQITKPGNVGIVYQYDEFGNLTQKNQLIDNRQFRFNYYFDSYGRNNRIEYPSGFGINYLYNSYGYLNEVRSETFGTIWKGLSVTAMGNFLSQELCGGLLTTKTYDPLEYLETVKTINNSAVYIHDQAFYFDRGTGNLMWRKYFRNNHTVELCDSFQYDGLNRLTQWKTTGQPVQLMEYSGSSPGNIDFKSDAGEYSYSAIKPHAVTSVSNPNGLISQESQYLTFTCFNKVSSITEGSYELSFTYGTDNQRIKSVLFNDPEIERTQYYLGPYELIERDGEKTHFHYISGADGIAAVYIKRDPGEDHLYAILTDHLGSVQAVADSTGFVCQHNGTAQEYNFDPWGRRRNPVDLGYTGIPAEFLIFRGFTGHEHHDPFGIINMNGRIYDPLLSRFLSPDNYVQLPDYSQSFNRYAYCLNNPLKYTDPDGEWFITALITFLNIYISGVQANDFEFNPIKWDWRSPNTYISIIKGGLEGYIWGSNIEAQYKFRNEINRYSLNVLNSDVTVQPDGSLVASNETLNQFSKDVFSDFKYRDRGILEYDPDKIFKEDVGAIIDINNPINGKYNIYFSNRSFRSKYTLFLDMGHEYVHLANKIELGDDFISVFSEYAAYSWNSITSGDMSWMNIYNKKYGHIFNPSNTIKFGLQHQIKLNKVVKPLYMNYGSFRLWTLIPKVVYN